MHLKRFCGREKKTSQRRCIPEKCGDQPQGVGKVGWSDLPLNPPSKTRAIQQTNVLPNANANANAPRANNIRKGGMLYTEMGKEREGRKLKRLGLSPERGDF